MRDLNRRLIVTVALVAAALLVAQVVPAAGVAGALGLGLLGVFDAPEFLPGVKAGADLTAAANQYKLVKFDANGDIVLCAAVSDVAIGSLYNNPNTGEAAQVAYRGVVLVQADGATNEGDKLAPAADAQAKVASVAAGSQEWIFGIAVKAAAGAGEVIPAIMTHSGPQNNATT